jgi:hypothetical protein
MAGGAVGGAGEVGVLERRQRQTGGGAEDRGEERGGQDEQRPTGRARRRRERAEIMGEVGREV